MLSTYHIVIDQKWYTIRYTKNRQCTCTIHSSEGPTGQRRCKSRGVWLPIPRGNVIGILHNLFKIYNFLPLSISILICQPPPPEICMYKYSILMAVQRNVYKWEESWSSKYFVMRPLHTYSYYINMYNDIAMRALEMCITRN